MFALNKNNKKIKNFNTVGEAVAFLKQDALTQKNDCEYTVTQKGFPLSHYTRTALDLQLEACR